MAESAGVLEIPVRIFDDSTPIIGLPLGVRVTSRDGSAVGEKHLLHTLLNVSLSCVCRYVCLLWSIVPNNTAWYCVTIQIKVQDSAITYSRVVSFQIAKLKPTWELAKARHSASFKF